MTDPARATSSHRGSEGVVPLAVTDAHIHLFEQGWGGKGPADADLTAYLELRRRYGIDRALVVGYEGEADQVSYAGNNEYLLRVAAEHDWVVPLCYLDRTAVAADPLLPGRWLERGAAGWSAYVIGVEEAQAWAALPEAVWSGLDAPALLSLNIDPAALEVLLPRLATLARVTVLISHLGLPGRGSGSPAERLRPVVEAVRTLPRCRVKVSGLYALAGEAEQPPYPSAVPYLEVLRDEVGLGSLVWGSDAPPVLDHQDFASQVDLSGYGVFDDADLAQLRSGAGLA